MVGTRDCSECASGGSDEVAARCCMHGMPEVVVSVAEVESAVVSDGVWSVGTAVEM